ncbi:MAG TPA: endo-1,4-beta-xylanase [Catenuloplanes sp.]|jgi:endo-1,4-beta-xylanase
MTKVPASRRGRRWAPFVGGAVAALALGTVMVVPSTSHASAPLRNHANALGFDIGFALDPGRLSETPYRRIADTEFNYVVAENAMKWDATEPTRGQFRWTGADQVRDYARASGKGLYGHTLVWHSQLPGYVQNTTNAATLRAVMREHITAVAGRYRGQVEAWDVVNEAFADGAAGARRDSVFQRVLGNGWIEEAFRMARVADPTAKLCINDYNTDGVGAKSTAIYNLVRDFKARGVPIDCVGFQSHLILNQVPGTMRQNLQRFADLGVDVRITELDIRMPLPVDATKLAQQAANFRTVFQACRAVTRCQGVTLWGITDRYSWVPGVFPGEGAALVWDNNYHPKPAYEAIHAVLSAGAPAPATTPPVTPRPTSPAPPPTPAPTTPPAAGGCRVDYSANSWNNGFTANITIRNNGSADLNGWSLVFSLADGQTLSGAGWNAQYSVAGSTLTARNVAFNARIPAGGSVGIGFNGTHSGTYKPPSSFALNGTACAA